MPLHRQSVSLGEPILPLRRRGGWSGGSYSGGGGGWSSGSSSSDSGFSGGGGSFGGGGASVLVRLPAGAASIDLVSEWVAPHELLHVVFPQVEGGHTWFS